MDKYERKNAFEEFKAGKYRVLISSNVTARGIDIQQVSIVINFDLPKDPHTYLHRIGRSGRWGRKGIGINFVTRRDMFNVKSIETYFNKEMEELPLNFEKVLN
jgi:superfamily II DNA/RNA helicase